MTAIPIPPPPLPIPAGVPESPLEIRPFPLDAAKAAWHDVSNWTTSAWKSAIGFVSNAGSISGTVVEAAIDAAVSRTTTAYGSFINDAFDYAYGLALSGAIALSDYGGYLLDHSFLLDDEIAFLAAFVTGAVLDEIHGIEGTITDVERWINGAIDNVQNTIRTWVIDDIASPLLREIAGIEQITAAGIEAWADTLRDEFTNLIHNETLERLALSATVAAAIAGILEWVAECGEPTCDLVGPKTDLSKLLKALEAAGGLAFLLALSGLTEQDLERLAAQVVAMASGAADDFIQAFFAEGDELGSALADTIAAVL